MAATICECSKCGKTVTVNFGECLRKGWPECCSQTMTLKNATRADIKKGVAEHTGVQAAKVVRKIAEGS